MGVPYRDFIPTFPMVKDPTTGQWRNAEPDEIPQPPVEQPPSAEQSVQPAPPPPPAEQQQPPVAEQQPAPAAPAPYDPANGGGEGLPDGDGDGVPGEYGDGPDLDGNGIPDEIGINPDNSQPGYPGLEPDQLAAAQANGDEVATGGLNAAGDPVNPDGVGDTGAGTTLEPIPSSDPSQQQWEEAGLAQPGGATEEPAGYDAYQGFEDPTLTDPALTEPSVPDEGFDDGLSP